jgi:hypothetical protein
MIVFFFVRIFAAAAAIKFLCDHWFGIVGGISGFKKSFCCLESNGRGGGL